MRVLLPLFLMFLLPALSAADVVVFGNGDRLTGRVVHKHGDTLVFETAHAGKLSIRWRDVSTLTTDKPVTVMLRGSEALSESVLRAAGDDRIRLGASGRDLRPDDIAHLNPTPEQSGIGVSYNGRASVSATDTRGNSTGRRLYAEAEFAARASDYRYNLAAKISRQRESGVQTASNWRADGNYDWFLDRRLFRYLRGSLEHDRFKDIDLRSTIGGGYGLQLVETGRSALSVRGGLDYVTVDHIAAANDAYPAFGWGLRASHRLETFDVELFHDHDGFLPLTGDGGVTLRSRSGLRAPLAGGLNASLQLNLDWEEDPAPGRKATDSTLLVGLGYEW